MLSGWRKQSRSGDEQSGDTPSTVIVREPTAAAVGRGPNQLSTDAASDRLATRQAPTAAMPAIQPAAQQARISSPPLSPVAAPVQTVARSAPVAPALSAAAPSSPVRTQPQPVVAVGLGSAAASRQIETVIAEDDVDGEAGRVRALQEIAHCGELRIVRGVVESIDDLSRLPIGSYRIPPANLPPYLHDDAVIVVDAEKKTAHLFVSAQKFDRVRSALSEPNPRPAMLGSQYQDLLDFLSRDIKSTEGIRTIQASSWGEAQIILITDPYLQKLRNSQGQSGVHGDSALNRQIMERRGVNQDPQSPKLKAMFLSVVEQGYSLGASDVDFRVSKTQDESFVWFKISGQFVRRPDPMPTEVMRSVLSYMYGLGKGQSEGTINWGLEQQLVLAVKLPRDVKFPSGPGAMSQRIGGERLRLRYASIVHDDSVVITMRIVPQDAGAVRSLDALGLEPQQNKILRRAVASKGGLICLCGTVDSGKTTAISAMLNELPETRKIVTLEDPVEQLTRYALHTTYTRALDEEHSAELVRKLRNLKRSALDGAYLGELRDTVTGRALQDVLSSGEKPLCTVHDNAAWKIPIRLADSSIGVRMEVLTIPGNMRLLGNLALLPKLCRCSIPLAEIAGDGDGLDCVSSGDGFGPATHEEWVHYREMIREIYDSEGEYLGNVRLRNYHGCSECKIPGFEALSGVKGRALCAELLEPDNEYLQALAEGKYLKIPELLYNRRGNKSVMDDDMEYLSTMGHAARRMLRGEVDPREVEMRFVDFTKVLRNVRQRRKREAERGVQ